jgi:hypothetical protein
MLAVLRPLLCDRARMTDDSLETLKATIRKLFQRESAGLREPSACSLAGARPLRGRDRESGARIGGMLFRAHRR